MKKLRSHGFGDTFFNMNFLHSIMASSRIIMVSDVMVRNPIVASPETSIVEVARLMRDKQISSVILVEDDKPVGIVTERDLVWRIIAADRSPDSLKAFDICSKPVLTISELDVLEGTVEYMKMNKIRRIVVVDRDDKVSGIMTTDDLGHNLKRISEDLDFTYLTLVQRT